MTIELAISGANLLALIGYFMRTESRLTRLETKLDFILPRGEK
ncbi:MAG TPA: hypothetical protein VJ698_15710 [Noviherbaspirillum sp.]|nr:hypothetical protein [Noviherbaspirillum sp.]HJV86912.1 hypothetical protein [Noviherbaspirillum sp.]